MKNFDLIIKDLQQQVYRRGINYSLDNLFFALNKLDNPHKKLKNIIHIAGTNGKGSTLTFLAAGLQKSGYTVGTYTSPHLSCYTERITLNTRPITKKKFVEFYLQIKKTCKELILTEFEILTLLSFLYFAQTKPDFLIYETGLGGRLDATNVINPILVIITSISQDHGDILGSTIEAITREKAGIFKLKKPVISAIQNKEITQILENQAKASETTITYAQPITNIPKDFILRASYQGQNLANAFYALKTLKDQGLIKFTPDLSLFKQANIWGRYTVITDNGLNRIIDGAHNEAGMEELLYQLKQEAKPQDITMVLGILKRKNYQTLLNQALNFKPAHIYLVDFDPPFSVTIDDIENKNIISEIELQKSLKLSKTTNIIYAGSLYFISKLKPLLLNNYNKIQDKYDTI